MREIDPRALDQRLRRDVGKGVVFSLLALVAIWFWFATEERPEVRASPPGANAVR